MRIRNLRRLAAMGGILALTLTPELARAQDGNREVGPSVTTPRTNKNKAGTQTSSAPKVGSEVLTPVPATASDPAPPGTRVERVDTPGAALKGANPVRGGGAGAGAGTEAAPNIPGMTPGSALPPGVMAAEGVIVDKIERPGKDLADEQIRLSIDPAHNWAEFAGPGSVPATDATKGKDDGGETPKRIALVLTKRSALTTFARTPEGEAVPDSANVAAPTEARSRVTSNPTANVPRRIFSPTNFTVLKPGQFVAVQYRKAGGVNEVVAMSLIVRPTQVTPAPGSGAAPSTTGRTGTAAGTGTGIKAGTAPAGSAPATPARVPRVPAVPKGVGGTSSTGRG